MSVYLLLFMLLAAGALLEWFRPQYGKKGYLVCWTAVTACLCLRYGQGVDYVTYHGLYETIPPVIDLSQGYVCGFYPEIGWRLLCAAFKAVHVPFWVFAMILGFAEMCLVHRFLQKYVPAKTAGLFMFYPVLFLSYLVSGLRQGLAMCIFLGVLVPLYLERKWILYILGVLVATSLHKVGYAWLLLPAISYLPVWLMPVLAGGAFAGGLLLRLQAVQEFLLSCFPSYHLQQFLQAGEISYFACAERLVSTTAILALYWWVAKRDRQTSETEDALLKAYLCGTCFYLLMCGNSYYASRYCAVFKILECAVLLILLQKRDTIVNLAAAFFLGLTILMGIKNLNAVIQQAIYYDPAVIKVWNLPYVSVFQKSKIYQYYPYEEWLEEIYNRNIEDQQLWMIQE